MVICLHLAEGIWRGSGERGEKVQGEVKQRADRNADRDSEEVAQFKWNAVCVLSVTHHNSSILAVERAHTRCVMLPF